jgi:hypothetical protein
VAMAARIATGVTLIARSPRVRASVCVFITEAP